MVGSFGSGEDVPLAGERGLAAAVNEAISGACEELPYARHTPADGLCVADDGHLDTASVLEVGRRMGRAYREMIRPRRVAGTLAQTN